MIRYRLHPNWKYQLAEAATFQTTFRPNATIDTPYITMNVDGLMTLYAGYACDGPSGPAIDTRNFIRPAFGHDGLYQLMRLQLLPRDAAARDRADCHLRAWCLEDGMSRLRAWWVYNAVKMFAARACDPKTDNCYAQILTAP